MVILQRKCHYTKSSQELSNPFLICLSASVRKELILSGCDIYLGTRAGQDKVRIFWLSCDSSDPDVTSWAEVFRRYVTTKVEVYHKILAEMASQEPMLRSAQVLKQEAEAI